MSLLLRSWLSGTLFVLALAYIVTLFGLWKLVCYLGRGTPGHSSLFSIKTGDPNKRSKN